MKRLKKFDVLLLCGLLLLAVGCANPADDAPDAVVNEPAVESAPTADEMAAAEVYALAADSTIGFVGAKVTGSHDGGFKTFEGTVSMTDGTPEGSSVEVTIDMNSMWSDAEKLTGHLKSPDFFNVEAFPTASFKSTEITTSTEGGYTLTGNLDLHGVTKQISFPANIEIGEHGFSATAEFSINRMDFEIKYPGKPDDLIRDEVLIKLDLRSAMHDAMAPAESADAEAEG